MLTLNWTGKSVSKKQSEKGIRRFSFSVMLVSAFYVFKDCTYYKLHSQFNVLPHQLGLSMGPSKKGH